MKSGVYKITNIINGKCYVGSSQNLKNRWRRHKRDLRVNSHHSSKLQRSFNKYGESSFKYEILSTCPIEYLIKLEQWFLDSIKPEYNMYLYANCHIRNHKVSDTKKANNKGCLGYKWTSEQRSRLSKSRKDLNIRVGLSVTKLKLTHIKTNTVIILDGIYEVIDLLKCNKNALYDVISGRRKSIYKYKVEIYEYS